MKHVKSAAKYVENKNLSVFKFLVISMFFSLFLLTPKMVLADSLSYKVFPTQQNISVDKPWKIMFSDNIDSASANNDSVKVEDESGNPVDIDISSGQNYIIVKPKTSYQAGKNYILYVNNIKSLKGNTLKSPGMMKFSTLSQAYDLVDTHNYKITDTFTVTSEEPTNVDLTFNLGTQSNSPYQKDLSLEVSGGNAKLTSDDSSHKKMTASAYVEPGTSVKYQATRTIQNSGIRYTKDLSKTSNDYSKFGDYSKYTSPEQNIESNSPEIKDKAAQLFNRIDNPYYKAKKAYEFVNTYMTYDQNNGNKGALNALLTGKGVCEDYAELFTALLRASGVPARVVTGYWVDSGEFSSRSTLNPSYDAHAWAEYYLPEYGWIVVEPTNAYFYNDERIVDYSYFSNLSNSSHFIEGYTSQGDDKDSTLYYSYTEGSGVKIDRETTIQILDK
ncbi:transglutaminase-like domain-containing protein [Clostridium sp. JN-1]|uniref:transglutaminase-like domain-containing protein n=1 Tax=Clostridium sp. JN-1 TaxID=2483110 RepID=UPI000F0B778E|nr:transglutaminase-like domain-containing protein [Clostridium sp. JN-1]